MSAKAQIAPATTSDPLKFDRSAPPITRAQPSARAASDEPAQPSPARILQQVIADDLSEPRVRKWPPLATAAFIIVTCGSFWFAVGIGVARGLR
jgi:hypothetical protein